MTFAAVQAAYERWLRAAAALTAGSRRAPSPPEVAAEAHDAFAAYWDVAGQYEREHPEIVGFRTRFPGWWAEGMAAGAIVDANPPPKESHGPITKAERDRRRQRRGA